MLKLNKEMLHGGSVSLTVWGQTWLMALDLIFHRGGIRQERRGKQTALRGRSLRGVLLERSLVL